MNLPAHRYRLYAPTAAVYALLFLFLTMIHSATANADLWVRLASGRLVVEEHIIPRHDPFTFTVRGDEWQDHEWLLGAAMYAANSVSYELLVVVASVLALAPFAIMHRLALRDRKADAALLILVGIAVLSAFRNLGVRPQLVNPIFFALLIVLIDARRRDGSTLVWLAAPLCLVWANLQAGFLVGPAVLAAWCGICLLERRDRRLSAAILAGSLVVPLLNAYGHELYTYALSASLSANPDREFVMEWRSPNFHDFLNIPTLLALLLLAYFGVRRQDTFARGLAVGTAAAMLISARFAPFFALALIYAVAPQLPTVRVPRGLSSALVASGLLCGAFFTVGVIALSAQDPPIDGVPVRGLEYLRSTAPESRVYAWQGWGSWMTYEGWPTFFDTRTHQVFPNDLIADYHKVEQTRGDWQAVLRRWDIEYVMMQPESDLAEALDGAGWRRVFEGEVEVIWQRPD